ncbi:MAG: putative Zn-dependent peptidase [Candidatus Peregrinibacteria bacterium GW2011_GWA2_54_9]|nr:MAG: putative Zn-dependent peptidase [Candidatus Peregrinibacteria bacterium GW2011_GWA2_54_9]
MFSIDVLRSGLPVITAPAEGTESVTVHVFVGAGSRYEQGNERGISHFLEHMFFKGGRKYRSTKEVSVAIDSKGGDCNAFTGKEYAGYFVKVAAEHAELACDVLSDMLLYALFPQEDIERERGVIIEEERMYQDTPMYRAGWDFEELLFGDHPLGWDTIGEEKVIRSVQQKDFRQYKERLYSPDNCTVVFAGNIDQARAVALGEKYFGTLAGSKERAFVPFEHYGKEKVFLRSKKTEQSHLVLGVPAVGALDKTGDISTRAGVDQSRLHEAIGLITQEYLLCAEKGVSDEELQRAKDYLRGKFTLSLEDSEERAHFYGKQKLLYPEVLDTDAYLARFDAVTKKQVDTLAARLFTPENFRLVVIGKEDNKAAMEESLA